MRTILLAYVDPAFRRVLMARHGAALRERGLRLVLADDELSARDRGLFDDCVELPAPAHVGEALAVLLDYAARHPLDGVCPESEAGLLPGVLLASRLGLRALSSRAALLTTNKWLSRRALADAGVRVPDFALAAGAADVRRFADAHGGYPVMLKAVASCMARLVFKVPGPADVEAAVARLHAQLPAAPDVLRCAAFARLARLDMGCDPAREFLVEEFFDGEPLEVDGLVLGGAVSSFGVTGQVPSAGPGFSIEAYLSPADLPAPVRSAVERTALAAAAALGLDDGGFSIELRARDERCVIIEVNGRLGQDDGFPELFARVIGREPLLVWLEALGAGVPPQPAPPRTVWPRGHHALAYVNHFTGGVFRGAAPRSARTSSRVADADANSDADADADVRVLIEPGTQLAPPGSAAFDPHVVCALASDEQSSATALRHARAALARWDVRISRRPCLPAGSSP